MKLDVADRQTRRVIPFSVPYGVDRLDIEFGYGPDNGGPQHNLVTLGLRDPKGWRGCAHRWSTHQRVHLGAEGATPGFAIGPVYPGDWSCVVDIHEMLNDRDAASCNVAVRVVAQLRDMREMASAPDEREHRPAPVTLRRTPGWYRGDLHAHTVHSDGRCNAADMAAAAAQAGLDFLALTDHNTTTQLRDHSGMFPLLLPIRGMEVTTFFGHCNVLGTERWSDWHVLDAADYNDLATSVRALGAMVVANHPTAIGNPHCTGCRWELPDPATVADAIEVWNGPWTNWESRNVDALEMWTRMLDRGQRLPAVAGSDAHDAGLIQSGTAPFTDVYAAALSEAAILDGVRLGRSYLTVGPRIRFRAVTPRGDVTLYPGQALGPSDGAVVDVTVTGVTGAATLWLIADGHPVESWDGERPVDETVRLPSSFRWVRWELRRGATIDGDLLIVTNPWFAPAGSHLPGAGFPDLS